MCIKIQIHKLPLVASFNGKIAAGKGATNETSLSIHIQIYGYITIRKLTHICIYIYRHVNMYL
jgi:hypothetical protein